MYICPALSLIISIRNSNYIQSNIKAWCAHGKENENDDDKKNHDTYFQEYSIVFKLIWNYFYMYDVLQTILQINWTKIENTKLMLIDIRLSSRSHVKTILINLAETCAHCSTLCTLCIYFTAHCVSHCARLTSFNIHIVERRVVALNSPHYGQIV